MSSLFYVFIHKNIFVIQYVKLTQFIFICKTTQIRQPLGHHAYFCLRFDFLTGQAAKRSETLCRQGAG